MRLFKQLLKSSYVSELISFKLCACFRISYCIVSTVSSITDSVDGVPTDCPISNQSHTQKLYNQLENYELFAKCLRFVYYLRVKRTSWYSISEFFSSLLTRCMMIVWQTEKVTCKEQSKYTTVYRHLFDSCCLRNSQKRLYALVLPAWANQKNGDCTFDTVCFECRQWLPQ